jgi:hypothetical protein
LSTAFTFLSQEKTRAPATIKKARGPRSFI